MSTETFDVPADCNTLEIWCRTRSGVFNAAMDVDLRTLDSTVFDTDRTSLQFRFVRVDASSRLLKNRCLGLISFSLC
jgi:hypothetical protein